MTMTKIEKTLVILATVAVLLLVALAFATPANGETYTAPGEPNEPSVLTVDSGANKVSFWCEPDDAGVKFEPVATPYVVPPPPEGKTWTLLVLKAGSGDGANEVIQRPVVGQEYRHSTGKDISHVILCWEDEEVTTTTTTPSTTTSSSTSTTSSTTTSSTTTSTTTPSTTTTGPTSTTSSSTTTTTDPTTTTTRPVTTTSNPTTTSVVVTTTVQQTTTTDVPTTLPKTGLGGGISQDWRLGGALVAFGLLLLLGSYVVNRLRGEA